MTELSLSIYMEKACLDKTGLQSVCLLFQVLWKSDSLILGKTVNMKNIHQDVIVSYHAFSLMEN